jgi:hypothetical protein
VRKNFSPFLVSHVKEFAKNQIDRASTMKLGSSVLDAHRHEIQPLAAVVRRIQASRVLPAHESLRARGVPEPGDGTAGSVMEGPDFRPDP